MAAAFASARVANGVIYTATTIASSLSIPTAANVLIARQAVTNPDQQQTMILIPALYQQGGPPPGAVVGIVLGSVLAFLLIVWLFSAISNQGNNDGPAYYEPPIGYPRRASTRPLMMERSPIARQERIIRESSVPRQIYEGPNRGASAPRGGREGGGGGGGGGGMDMVEVVEESSSVAPTDRDRRRSKRRSSRN